jgi:hypothetical protein
MQEEALNLFQCGDGHFFIFNRPDQAAESGENTGEETG